MSDTPRPGSNAALDARVARLEERQDQMQTQLNSLQVDMQVVKAEQVHTKELMASRFTGVDQAIQTLASKFDNLVLVINAAMSDPNASPAGRSGMDQVKRIHERIDETNDRIDEVAGVAKANNALLLKAVGAATVVATLVSILGWPLVRQALGGQ